MYSEESGTQSNGLDMFENIEESMVLPEGTGLGWEDSKAGAYELFIFPKDHSIATSENYQRYNSISHKSASGIEAKVGAQDGFVAGCSYFAVITPAGRRAKVARLHIVPADKAKSILEEVEKLNGTAASDNAILHVLLSSLYEEKELFFDALIEYRMASAWARTRVSLAVRASM